MAKLADYYYCDLRYTDEGYVIQDEDDVHNWRYEDNDEYIKEFWGEYPFIGKFPVMFRGNQVQVLVFKDFEQYFGVFKYEIIKKKLTEAEVAFIRRALKHFQNWLGSGEEPVLDNLVSNF